MTDLTTEFRLSGTNFSVKILDRNTFEFGIIENEVVVGNYIIYREEIYSIIDTLQNLTDLDFRDNPNLPIFSDPERLFAQGESQK